MKIKVGNSGSGIGKLEEGTIKYEEISPEEAEEIAQKTRVIIHDTASKIETAYYTDSYTILNIKHFTKYHYYKLVGISRVTLHGAVIGL